MQRTTQGRGPSSCVSDARPRRLVHDRFDLRPRRPERPRTGDGRPRAGSTRTRRAGRLKSQSTGPGNGLVEPMMEAMGSKGTKIRATEPLSGRCATRLHPQLTGGTMGGPPAAADARTCMRSPEGMRSSPEPDTAARADDRRLVDHHRGRDCLRPRVPGASGQAVRCVPTPSMEPTLHCAKPTTFVCKADSATA